MAVCVRGGSVNDCDVYKCESIMAWILGGMSSRVKEVKV